MDDYNKIINIIKKMEKKDIEILQEGFVESTFLIKNVNIKIKNEIIKIKSLTEKVCLNINLNEIYYYKINEKSLKIKIWFDNDLIINLQAK